MSQSRIPLLAAFALCAALASSPSAPRRAAAGSLPTAPHSTTACVARAVCDRSLGVALTLPAGWTVAPMGKFGPGALAFWSIVPHAVNATLHLVVSPLGKAATCTNSQAVRAVALALAAQAPPSHIPSSASLRPLATLPL